MTKPEAEKQISSPGLTTSRREFLKKVTQCLCQGGLMIGGAALGVVSAQGAGQPCPVDHCGGKVQDTCDVNACGVNICARLNQCHTDDHCTITDRCNKLNECDIQDSCAGLVDYCYTDRCAKANQCAARSDTCQYSNNCSGTDQCGSDICNTYNICSVEDQCQPHDLCYSNWCPGKDFCIYDACITNRCEKQDSCYMTNSCAIDRCSQGADSCKRLDSCGRNIL